MLIDFPVPRKVIPGLLDIPDYLAAVRDRIARPENAVHGTHVHPEQPPVIVRAVHVTAGLCHEAVKIRALFDIKPCRVQRFARSDHHWQPVLHRQEIPLSVEDARIHDAVLKIRILKHRTAVIERAQVGKRPRLYQLVDIPVVLYEEYIGPPIRS